LKLQRSPRSINFLQSEKPAPRCKVDPGGLRWLYNAFQAPGLSKWPWRPLLAQDPGKAATARALHQRSWQSRCAEPVPWSAISEINPCSVLRAS